MQEKNCKILANEYNKIEKTIGQFHLFNLIQLGIIDVLQWANNLEVLVILL